MIAGAVLPGNVDSERVEIVDAGLAEASEGRERLRGASLHQNVPTACATGPHKAGLLSGLP